MGLFGFDSDKMKMNRLYKRQKWQQNNQSDVLRW